MTNNTSNFVPSGELEKHGMVTSFIRIFTVPLLNILPDTVIRKMMRRSSNDASNVIASGGSTKALEVMYTRNSNRPFSRGILIGAADIFWHHVVSQSKALRNRLKITRSTIDYHISSLVSDRAQQNDKDPIRVLSIAGGSSRSTIQVVSDLKNNGTPQEVEVITLDKDQSALDIGKQLAADAGVSSNFHWICGDARDVSTLVPNKHFDIVEIVGLLDYFDDERTIRLMKVARDVMRQNGVIVVANIMPNPEVAFIHKTGWPKMVYRTREDLHSLFEKSGFTKTETIVEPLKVHCVAIAKNE